MRCSATCRFSSPAKAASGEDEGEKLDEIKALMSTMVQQMQELPEAIKPIAAPSASFGEDLATMIMGHHSAPHCSYQGKWHARELEQCKTASHRTVMRCGCTGAAGNQHGQSAFAAHAAHALPHGEPLEPSALSNVDTPSQPPHPASYMEVSP